MYITKCEGGVQDVHYEVCGRCTGCTSRSVRAVYRVYITKCEGGIQGVHHEV